MLNQPTRIRSEKCVSSEKTQQTLNAFKNSARPRPLAARTKQPFILLALLFSLPVSFFLLWPTVLLAVCLCYTAPYVKYIFSCMNFILDFVLCRETFLTVQLLKYYFIIKTPVWEFEFFVYEDITLCLVLQPPFFCVFAAVSLVLIFCQQKLPNLKPIFLVSTSTFIHTAFFFSSTFSASQKRLKL